MAIVLGGGVPTSPNSPPEYVKIRCDAAAAIYQKSTKAPSIICLSAGTAHLPQLINPSNGLPIWESSASAAYLLDKYPNIIPSEKLFAETTSYDTISNAFFTRTNFTDIMNWKNILVITNEFHMNRTNVIFDWVFQASDINKNETNDYKLYYLSCPNVSLSDDAIQTRKAHEAKSERNVRENLSVKYKSMQDIWMFLTSQHDLHQQKYVLSISITDNVFDVSKSKQVW